MDAITNAILRQNLASLVDVMQAQFQRTGHSAIARQAGDFSCTVLDRDGGLIVAPTRLLLAAVYPKLAGRIVALYGGQLAAGDVFVCNHPDDGVPDALDLAVVAPVFAGGELVGFVGTIAGMADFGGRDAGTMSATAAEPEHPGVLIPPIRIVEAGRALADIERLILANSRQPFLVRGDLRAQIAVTRLGVAGMAELCDRFGVVTDAVAAIRAALGELTDEPPGAPVGLNIVYAEGRPGQGNRQCETMGAAATAAPIELLETQYPCRVTRFDLAPERGGLRRDYELLADATVIGRVAIGLDTSSGPLASRRVALQAGDTFHLQTEAAASAD